MIQYQMDLCELFFRSSMRYPKMPQTLEEAVRTRYPAEGSTQIAEIFGIPKEEVRNTAKKLGIRSRIRKSTDKFPGLNDKIKRRYENEGPGKLSEEYGVTRAVVIQRARKLGVKIKDQGEIDYPGLNEAIQERYETEGSKLLAEEFGLSRAAVTTRAGKLGIIFKSRTQLLWDERKDQLLRERYPEEGASEELQTILGVSWDDLAQKAAKLGVKFRDRLKKAGQTASRTSTHVNTKFFETWTPDSAYVLGYTWADGCVTNHSVTPAGTQRRQIAFGCKRSDKEILVQIREAMGAKHQIWDVEEKRDGKIRYISKLNITNTYLANRLQELHGIPSRKSHRNNSFPMSVPDDVLGHFLRGYFDGDGSVARDRSYYRIQFYGTQRFLEGIRKEIVERLKVRECPLVQVKEGWDTGFEISEEDRERIAEMLGSTPGVYYICWQNSEDLVKIYNLLYSQGGILLKRKRDRLRNYLRNYWQKEVR